ncbi:MAG: cytochrome-c oxidase, cbb3-type subunit III [Rhodospirillales bacterium]|nr:cytochrome-c oxidase, cbb3-type subunit III [Rhodospirillales bacterium]MDH3790312.1 cytochrome-c oxidase, cbb3-type subunit III [Rhodospirillales bacterium]MDH3910584.1 cytochrome-c oxidase, cbb3-type subunit III [Rhodospirillales bacterium]MDH3919841.1 cytochrome-c oxidase, cbb3-type subunit III [Rhodospirillales bacterium]MDH3967377.1 cytochrome-c oxidase, cbb3-type subunit III [Rhodospirillales bacterium]
MPTKIEKDSVTGTETTGHEWDGIKELNTPLPRWWLYVLYATIIWSLVYYLLYPTIPGIAGLMGYSQREEVVERMAQARARQAGNLDGIAASPLEAIKADPDLLNFALTGGRAAFADNCAPCHAAGGAGRPGYPTLADDSWLWGGTLDEIETTLRHGVRTDDDDTREGEMPAFGADELLEKEQIEAVADYVLSLSTQAAGAAGEGLELYAENCASCHGGAGQGGREYGAPRLADQIWLYGGEKADIVAQITKPRHGVMPAWAGRLDDTTIKMLAVYVHALGGGE